MINFQSSAAAMVAALMVSNPAAATPTDWDQGYEVGFDAAVVATSCKLLAQDHISPEIFIDQIKYVYRTNKTDMAMHAEIMASDPSMKPCLDAYNSVF